MAEDVDTKFIPKTGSTAISGNLTAKTLVSSNGGSTQSSTVLTTGPSASSAFNFYDDNVRIDGAAGRRLWIAGANGTDVGIRTRSGSENLNRISLRAATIDLQGAVTISGTLNVTGNYTKFVNWEANETLCANMSSYARLTVTGVGTTFVLPPSRRVIIGFGGYVPTDATSVYLSYAIKTGSNIDAGSVVVPVIPAGWGITQPAPHGLGANGTSAGSTQWVSCYATYVWTFNEPHQVGATFNLVPYYINRNTRTLEMYRSYVMIQPDL